MDDMDDTSDAARGIRRGPKCPTAEALSSAQNIHVVARGSQRDIAVSHLPVTRDQILSQRHGPSLPGRIGSGRRV